MNATTQTKTEVKALASQVIGDGGSPNMFFVSTYPHVYVVDEFGDGEFQKVDWLEEEYRKDYIHTYGPFHSYSEAQKVYDELELDLYTGICGVCMEDRLTGNIKEKFLRKVVKVDYHFDETVNAEYFGYK